MNQSYVQCPQVHVMVGISLAIKWYLGFDRNKSDDLEWGADENWTREWDWELWIMAFTSSCWTWTVTYITVIIGWWHCKWDKWWGPPPPVVGQLLCMCLHIEISRLLSNSNQELWGLITPPRKSKTNLNATFTSLY